MLALLPLATALVSASPEALAKNAGQVDPGPALAAVVKDLGSSDPAGSQDLAWVALSEMLHAYEQAVEHAGQSRRSHAESRAKLRKWQASAAGFLAGLRAQLEAVENGAPVTLDTEPDGSLLVVVQGRPTVVSGPDLGDPGALGRRILSSFCSSHGCPTAAESTTNPAVPPEPPPSTGHWSFADHQPTRFETQDGLSFEFSGFRDRTEKQATSAQLAAELDLLAKGLSAVRSLGQRVDLYSVHIVSTPGGQDPRVILNRQGDFLYLPVPGLLQHPELVGKALPWIEARMEGRPYQLVLTQADGLVPPGGAPRGSTE